MFLSEYGRRRFAAAVLSVFTLIFVLQVFAGSVFAAEPSALSAEDLSASAVEETVSVQPVEPVEPASPSAAEKKAMYELEAQEKEPEPEAAEAEDEPESIVGYVQTSILNVRAKPNGNAQILTTLKAGKEVQIYYQYGNWYGITCGNVKGWVSADYVHAGELNLDREAIIATAKEYMGCPYVWGGTSPGGFDCSGFVQYVFAKHGLYLERCADDQYYQGTALSNREVQPGDVVVFGYGLDDINHIGIYIGGGNFIHCGNSGVEITSLFGYYYCDMYVGAARVIPE